MSEIVVTITLAGDMLGVVEAERNVIVVGAGGHGREVASAVLSAGVTMLGFVDDTEPSHELLRPFGVGYLGSVQWVGGNADLDADYLIGIGSGSVREEIEYKLGGQESARPLTGRFASVGIDVRRSPGSIVFDHATVTTNIDIGRHTHVGRGAAVGHDCVLGNFVTVMPLASVSGNVVVGDRATIGTGAVIRQGQSIGADAFVGAGAVVVDDVPDGVTVVGNPARTIRAG